MEVRYRTLLRLVPELATVEKLLEVGAGEAGLRDLLPRPLTEVDVAFEGEAPPGVTRVTASATDLPLPGDSFDAVISLDTIEHLRRDEREPAIAEMLRVLRPGGCLAVGAPTGATGARGDSWLQRSLRRRHGHGDPWIAEHQEFGLPTTEDLEAAIRRAEPAASVKSHSNLNMAAFYLLQAYRTGRYYRLARALGAYSEPPARLLAAILSRLNRRPAYRTFVVARTAR
jgi:SAM-dependent methyltransferase